MLFDAMHERLCPLQLLLNVMLVFLVRLVPINADAEPAEQRIPVAVVIRGVVRPVPIKSKTEIRDLEVTGLRNKEVVWLDVPMDTPKPMGFFDAAYHLGDVESRNSLRQDILSDQEAEEVSPWHVLHDEVEARGVLETRHEGDYPVMPRGQVSDKATNIMWAVRPGCLGV
jgi:hypothetical protein